MRCSQCSHEAVENRKMCAHCAELARNSSKRCRERMTDSQRLRRNETRSAYKVRTKEKKLCLQCGKINDRLPKFICSICTKKQYNQQAKRREANPEKHSKMRQVVSRTYYLKNTEKVNQRAKNERERRRGAEGILSLADWNSVLDKYGHKCLWCGRSDVKMTIDHVIPISKGGTNTVGNVQPLCKSCNSKKNAKTMDFRLFGSTILEWT